VSTKKHSGGHLQRCEEIDWILEMRKTKWIGKRVNCIKRIHPSCKKLMRDDTYTQNGVSTFGYIQHQQKKKKDTANKTEVLRKEQGKDKIVID